jgi:hypothetical protein
MDKIWMEEILDATSPVVPPQEDKTEVNLLVVPPGPLVEIKEEKVVNPPHCSLET